MFDLSQFRSQIKELLVSTNPLVIFFVVLTLLFGTCVIFITPPFQGPDEDIHFTTCWKIVHGDFTRSVPQSLAAFSHEHGYLLYHPERKYTFDKWQKSLKWAPIQKEKNYIYNRITFYAAFSYLPALTGVGLSSIFTQRYLPALYMGRICCLLAYIILGALALHFCPSCKAVIFLLLMMPQTIYQSSVISYDGVTNGMICLWAVLLFRDIFTVAPNAKSLSTPLIVCSILLCLCKVPYMIVLGSLLLLLLKKDLRNKRKIWVPLICSLLVLVLTISLKKFMTDLPLPENAELFTRIMAPGKGSVDTLVEHVDKSPLEVLLQFPSLLFSTLTDGNKLMIYIGSFSGCLGALDTLLPPILLSSYLLLILFFCITSENSLSLQGRLYFLLCGLGLAGMIFMIFAITYEPSNGTIPGITGRYFIPSSFLLALAMSNAFITFQWMPKIENVLAITGSSIIGITMIITLLQRYYFNYWWERTI